jgi:cAMP-specific phosphodiesterase 4
MHLRWVAALEEEFFMQGDAESAQGMPVTPPFERGKPGASKSQVRMGFLGFLHLPGMVGGMCFLPPCRYL